MKKVLTETELRQKWFNHEISFENLTRKHVLNREFLIQIFQSLSEMDRALNEVNLIVSLTGKLTNFTMEQAQNFITYIEANLVVTDYLKNFLFDEKCIYSKKKVLKALKKFVKEKENERRNKH